MSTKDIREIEEGNCSNYTNNVSGDDSSLCTSPEVVIIIQKVCKFPPKKIKIRNIFDDFFFNIFFIL